MKVSSLLELALFFIRNCVVTVLLSMGKMMYGEVGTYGSCAGLDTKVIECLCVRIKVLEAIQSGFCHWRAEDRTVMRRWEMGMMETGWDGRDEDEETKERFSESKGARPKAKILHLGQCRFIDGCKQVTRTNTLLPCVALCVEQEGKGQQNTSKTQHNNTQTQRQTFPKGFFNQHSVSSQSSVESSKQQESCLLPDIETLTNALQCCLEGFFIV